MLLIFVLGSMVMGKELLADLKFAIFKNWLDTRPKMETHEPNVYPTILGGVSRIANFSSARGSFPIMIDPNTKIKSTVSFMGL